MKVQQTVATAIEIIGQALFNGTTVTMRILPQPVDTGIYFKRLDLPGKPEIKADIHSVIDTNKHVTIGKDDWRISTIEHLMAVFHGLGVDNAMVEVDGEELPLGDGSGLYFAKRILETGLIAQEQPRRYTYITEPVWVEGIVYRHNEPVKSTLIALPSNRFQVSFTFTSDHQATGTQYYHYYSDPDTFIHDIAPARTIAFLKEIEYLRSQGFVLGGALDCFVIVGEDSYQNELRFNEEIVRHKILDIFGDLYLLGPLVGHLIAIRSGHALDMELAKKISISQQVTYK